MPVTETMSKGYEREGEELKRRHANEIMALKEAHSHTRMLSELSQGLETSLQNVSHLQARFRESHQCQMQENEHGLLAEQ